MSPVGPRVMIVRPERNNLTRGRHLALDANLDHPNHRREARFVYLASRVLTLTLMAALNASTASLAPGTTSMVALTALYVSLAKPNRILVRLSVTPASPGSSLAQRELHHA
jgi:hypothetical protein